MNFTISESSIYLDKILKTLPATRGIELIVAPPTIALQPLSLQAGAKIKLAAQNAFYQDYGDFDGETSFAQLRGLADYCLIGHYERRANFGENDKMIQKKVAAAIRNGITPILCVGEIEPERASLETADVIRDQVLGALANLSADDVEKVIIAYEPVWAISSAKSAKLASPFEVEDAVKLIRGNIEEVYGKKAAENIAILFGGSVNPDNARAYLNINGVNGLMFGKASLILSEFCDIVRIANQIAA